MEQEQEFGVDLKWERGLSTKLLNLAHENRSPNQDQELSSGFLTEREKKQERLLDILTAIPLCGAAVFN